MSRRFLVFAPQDRENMQSELGRADYSYRFVLEYFRPLLAGLGEVRDLASPSQSITPLPGVTDHRLLFMPPHRVPLAVAHRSIPVFAWEYTTIPTEPFAADSRNDWREVLGRAPGAITHSRFAVTAVREALGDRYPIASVPAPVWDRFAELRGTARPTQLALPGRTADSGGADDEPMLGSGVVVPVEESQTIFTSVVNPHDGRKVWADTITAFAAALGDDPDAVLILKVVHHDPELGLSPVIDLMRRLAPYRCRIIGVAGYLPDTDFEALLRATDFVVNSSRGEGQCLPLMEFMSAGVPAIAPDHTAMAEYVNQTDAFVVGWWREWSWWPHDPRRFLRCMRHPVDWDSLRSAFLAARAATATQREQMGTQATDQLRRYCSFAIARDRMTKFLDELSP